MSAKIIDGKKMSEEILREITGEVVKIKERYGIVPGLVTILLGKHPASVSYVKLKIKAAKRCGFKEKQVDLPEDLSEKDLLALIHEYNIDDSIHGILVQLPLPGHIDKKRVINAIDPEKDVDGFHPINVGRLIYGGEEVRFPPCTPAGIREILIRSGIETDKAEVVVVGRSNIVGKPIANMLFQKGPSANSTVTVVHTGTRDLASHCKRADILIVAAGVPGLVKPGWIKPGACVIDVGVNKVGEKPSQKHPGRMLAILKGDVDFEAVREIAGFITPVPGGVGPMTIAMLMRNTLTSLKYKLEILS